MDPKTSIPGMFKYEFKIKNLKPIFIIKLITDKKGPFRENGMPYSGSQIEYFEFHIDDKILANEVFLYRKKYFDVEKAYELFIEMNILSENEIIFINSYMDEWKKRKKENQKQAMKRPEVLEKIRQNNKRTATERGKIISKHWNDPVRRQKYINACNNKEMLSKRIETFKKNVVGNQSYVDSMRKPERLKKISDSTKKRWNSFNENQKKDALQKFSRCGARNFEINNHKMNKLEFLVANMLTSLNLKWEHEKPIVDDKKSYFPDFYLPEKNIIIECFGAYWHADPKIYKEDFILRNKNTAKQCWEIDKIKIETYKKVLNCEVIVLWENEIYNTEVLYEKIKEIANEKNN